MCTLFCIELRIWKHSGRLSDSFLWRITGLKLSKFFIRVFDFSKKENVLVNRIYSFNVNIFPHFTLQSLNFWLPLFSRKSLPFQREVWLWNIWSFLCERLFYQIYSWTCGSCKRAYSGTWCPEGKALWGVRV